MKKSASPIVEHSYGERGWGSWGSRGECWRVTRCTSLWTLFFKLPPVLIGSPGWPAAGASCLKDLWGARLL